MNSKEASSNCHSKKEIGKEMLTHSRKENKSKKLDLVEEEYYDDDDDERSLKKPRRNIEWHHHYAALMKFYEAHGHCNVPQSLLYECDIEGENGMDIHYVGKLGSWVNSQKSAKGGTHKTYNLTPERDEKIQTLIDEGKIILLSCKQLNCHFSL
jgi:hypothetical protein